LAFKIVRAASLVIQDLVQGPSGTEPEPLSNNRLKVQGHQVILFLPIKMNFPANIKRDHEVVPVCSYTVAS
jgi:hypothetical protein